MLRLTLWFWTQTLICTGIDRSGHRLDRVLEIGSVVVKEAAKIQSENAILLRADLSDIWTLVFQDPSLLVQRHYLLYPNPYPKSKHLQRRWHGHPIFPILLGLGNLSLYRLTKSYSTCDIIYTLSLQVAILLLEAIGKSTVKSLWPQRGALSAQDSSRKLTPVLVCSVIFLKMNHWHTLKQNMPPLPCPFTK